MEKANIITTTYMTKFTGFYVDIESNCKLYNAWLWHEKYGVKMHMFGVFKKDFTKQEMVEMTEANLDNQGYIKFYTEQYMND